MNAVDPWGRKVFWLLLITGLLDRLALLLVFSTRYIGMDDAVIWSAAVDYSMGEFHGPYFYGQDYAPMLEALLAAPFVRAGATLRIVVPAITAALAMLPYWSFAFWNRRNGMHLAACAFLAMPVLLPNEYGLMTSVTRGWVTGTGLLALLPWTASFRSERLASLSAGLVASLACLMNPNALPFAAAFIAWYLLNRHAFARHVVLVVTGASPGVLMHAVAQAWCNGHPERIVNSIRGWGYRPAWADLLNGLTYLPDHFEWLAPIIWPFGHAIIVALLVLVILAFRRKWTVLGVSMSTGLLVILFALSLAKSRDGIGNVFMPLSRIFLAAPLLFCWGLSLMPAFQRPSLRALGVLVVGSVGSLAIKVGSLPRTIDEQIAGQGPWSSERPLADMRQDLAHLRTVCAENRVELIIPLITNATIAPHYRALLYPALDRSLPPTYLQEKENRYWVREEFAHKIVSNVLVICDDWSRRSRKARSIAKTMDLSGYGPDRYLLLKGNTLTADSIASILRAP